MKKENTIIITGSSSGIGKELAIHLSNKYQDKINLVITGRNKTQLDDVKEELKKNNTPVLSITADLTKEENSKKLIESTLQNFNHINYIVLNAGISMWSTFAKIENLQQLKNITDINYHSVLYSIYYALPSLRKQKGTVAVISSLQGYISMPKHSVYSASKHALHGFINSLELEEPNIHFQKYILGWVRNTNLRKNRLIEETKYQEHNQKSNSFSCDVKTCAKSIGDNLFTNRRKIFIPKSLIIVLIFWILFPSFIKKSLRKRIKKEQNN